MVAQNAKYQLLVYIVLLCMFFANGSFYQLRAPRIAIIGGGIGGTATAYEISKLAARSGYDIDLDLYEEGDIGGRLATTKINGREFETGGSIIHVENKHMTDYVEGNGLNWYSEPSDYMNKDVTGFYDGKDFVLTLTDSTMMNMIRMLWRYGLDLVTFESIIVKPMLHDFKRIYEAQEEEVTFDDVHSLIAYMRKDFPDLMKLELKKYLQRERFSDRFINEFIFLATNINYNQNTNIPAFVGSVALAGATDGSLRSVEGGNKRVPQTLLVKSDARLIKARVESISLRPDSTFALLVENTSLIYDYVVIACPIIENFENKITFEGFPDLNIPRIKYQQTVATLVHGELNHTFFHYKSPKGLPNSILSLNNELFYNCITVQDPVTFDWKYDRKVFKVFSKDVLTVEQLDLLFRKRDHVTVVPWLAYPLYDLEERNLSFVLHNNLFYLNTIEWAASAMEMSAISGVNIALHIHKQLENSGQLMN